MLRGELVYENCTRELVCLKCREGLVTVCNWAPGAVAMVAFKPSGDVAIAGLTPEAAWSVQGRGARQSEQLGSWHCGRVATWPELVYLLRRRGPCRAEELVRVSNWAHGAVA